MASNPPGACCNRGFIHSGEPKGTVTKTSDGKADIYIASADASNKKDAALLFLPDIFGIYPNSKLLADSFAAQGYTTAVLDLFSGDAPSMPPPANFEIFKWINEGFDGKTPHTVEAIDPIVVEGIKTLKAQGFNKIGAVAYCFGAKYLVRHYKDGIDVGFTAHPSFVTDEELAGITGPLSIAAAETDSIFPAENRHKSEEILKGTKQPYQINLFSGVEHGFAVRGDPSVRSAVFAQEQALRQALAWFDEYLIGNQ